MGLIAGACSPSITVYPSAPGVSFGELCFRYLARGSFAGLMVDLVGFAPASEPR